MVLVRIKLLNSLTLAGYSVYVSLPLFLFLSLPGIDKLAFLMHPIHITLTESNSSLRKTGEDNLHIGGTQKPIESMCRGWSPCDTGLRLSCPPQP